MLPNFIWLVHSESGHGHKLGGQEPNMNRLFPHVAYVLFRLFVSNKLQQI